MFDIGDEKHPKLVSLVKTEAEDTANCQAAVNQAGGPYPNFGVGIHYCNVDRRDNPRVLACAHWFAGLRLYDIRNPYRPKELAYIQTGNGEQVVYTPRIMLEQKRIWTQTNTTFYVLKLADSVTDPILAESP